jgi:hypothetical protein
MLLLLLLLPRLSSPRLQRFAVSFHGRCAPRLMQEHCKYCHSLNVQN